MAKPRKGKAKIEMSAIKWLFLLASVTYCDADWLTKTGDHEGGFLRVGLWGTPSASASTTLSSGQKVDLDGVASIARVQIGWSVIPRVALHVDLIDFLVPADSGIQAFSWGPGITVYSPQWNLFATGVFGYSLLNADGDKSAKGTRWYIGIGKEFLLNRCNGLGVMATWERGSWKDSENHQKWNESGPGFQVTRTYN